MPRLDMKISTQCECRKISLWDDYAQFGYENLYKVRPSRVHREMLVGLLLPSNGGAYLDAGCRTDNMLAKCADLRYAYLTGL